MLQKIFTNPVELNIDGKIITFNSIADFEFSLGARATIPLEKINNALKATPGELDLESNAIVVAIEQLTELNNQSSEPGDITKSLKVLNPVIFSNDNGWRDLFTALKNDTSSESSKFKKIALTNYLQYLKNRQEMIFTIKAQVKKDSNQKEHLETVNFRTGELEIDGKFDSGKIAKKLGMTKIPAAKGIALKIKESNEIGLLLANYQCKLIIKEGVKFIDSDNVEHPITIGMNKIGRGRECSIKFADTMQRISRLHLIINNHDNNKLELTDLSTYGTHYLEQSS